MCTPTQNSSPVSNYDALFLCYALSAVSKLLSGNAGFLRDFLEGCLIDCCNLRFVPKVFRLPERTGARAKALRLSRQSFPNSTPRRGGFRLVRPASRNSLKSDDTFWHQIVVSVDETNVDAPARRSVRCDRSTWPRMLVAPKHRAKLKARACLYHDGFLMQSWFDVFISISTLNMQGD